MQIHVVPALGSRGHQLLTKSAIIIDPAHLFFFFKRFDIIKDESMDRCLMFLCL